ncbi:hypothetical protein Tco_0058761 [Tanacetum coccineum]
MNRHRQLSHECTVTDELNLAQSFLIFHFYLRCLIRSSRTIIIEQRVEVDQKARILELKRRNHKEHCSDILYAVSIKEDTTYLCPKLHSASTKRRSIRRIQMKPYAVLDCKSWNILEYNNRGAHAKKPHYAEVNMARGARDTLVVVILEVNSIKDLGRSIKDFDKDADVSLVDDTKGRSGDAEMFDTNELHGDEVVVDMPVGEKQEHSAKEREVNTSIEDSVALTTIEEITLAQTLIQINAAKPKVVTTTATTITTTRPKARGVVVQEPSEFRTPQESQPLKIKDKGKAIMIEPEVPLKRKDQVALDEDLARNLQAQLEAELIEEERLARKKEEEANIALIESWDNTQAMMEADFELAQRLQTEEQGEITIEERSRLFVELMNKRKKHFAMLRAEEKRRKPPTKAQKRNLMSTYLKNMGGYKHNQLKSKSYEEIQKLFDNEMRRVNTFIPMDSEVVKSKKETGWRLYWSRNEIKKLEAKLWNLKVKESDKLKVCRGLPELIHGSVVVSKPKTMQEATEMATKLMDKKISTLAERQAENKRKLDNNNQVQQ